MRGTVVTARLRLTELVPSDATLLYEAFTEPAAPSADPGIPSPELAAPSAGPAAPTAAVPSEDPAVPSGGAAPSADPWIPSAESAARSAGAPSAGPEVPGAGAEAGAGAGLGPFRSLERTALWVGHRIEDRRGAGLCSYLLRGRETGAVVGTCGVRPGPTTADPELGYRIATGHRGHGLATEAATAVVEECRTAGAKRVWASVRPDNAASLRVVERLGMRLAATDRDRFGPLHRYLVEL